jgi:hypothetical protein
MITNLKPTERFMCIDIHLPIDEEKTNFADYLILCYAILILTIADNKIYALIYIFILFILISFYEIQQFSNSCKTTKDGSSSSILTR